MLGVVKAPTLFKDESPGPWVPGCGTLLAETGFN